MKVGIYNEPSGTIGGSEYLVSVMAHALASRHDVEIVHHNPTLGRDQLAGLSGLDLSAVSLRATGRRERPDPKVPSGVRHLPERYAAERAWHAELSEPYDVFINVTHDVPPFCHAPHGVLVTLFPAYARRSMWPWNATDERPLKSRVRSAGFAWMWRQRFRSYRHRLSISSYARQWTSAWWGIDTGILHPPVDTTFPRLPKANLVLSVGRFATYSHAKRQVEMMTMYRDLRRTSLQGWCCYSVGGLGDRPADRAYFDDVARLAAGCGARTIANIPRAELRDLFARAKVFWHAAGYGTDRDSSPFEAEHFGIATVEAMAAGAVPVVYDHGGQTEIVEHGRSGFLWRTLDDLHEYTTMLVRDEPLRERMAEAARVRAARYSREVFVASLARLMP